MFFVWVFQGVLGVSLSYEYSMVLLLVFESYCGIFSVFFECFSVFLCFFFSVVLYFRIFLCLFRVVLRLFQGLPVVSLRFCCVFFQDLDMGVPGSSHGCSKVLL